MTGKNIFGGLLLILAVFTAGCGDSQKTGYVTGKVTIDGQPAPAGLAVIFYPQDAKVNFPSKGITDANGNYEMSLSFTKKGVHSGVNKVAIENDGGDDSAIVNVKIPRRFNEETEITYDVKPGKQTYDINIETNVSK
ncbi:MAG: hypothetical protein LBQ54_00835 [Planctomycetaceae bacterium]|jgi:hypothetical protein|nr:hypothetical protein [Planctomycetaceae bacterium]